MRQIRVRPYSKWRKPAPKEFWDSLQPNQICVDIYGNQIFWGTLRELLKRGYYRNIGDKKAAMVGTFSNYGWQYSAEERLLGRVADPQKYKDEIPQNPKGKEWPLHITARLRRKKICLLALAKQMLS